MKERIPVYGAGVIGSIHALRLAKAGHPVSVLARGERLAALRSSGLRIRNVLTGEEEASAGASRFVPGFGAFGGYREGSRIDYLDRRSREKPGAVNRSPTTLGVLSEAARPALQAVRSVPESAGLPCAESPDIASWRRPNGSSCGP